MVKKRLSDLLREEVKRPEEGAADEPAMPSPDGSATSGEAKDTPATADASSVAAAGSDASATLQASSQPDAELTAAIARLHDQVADLEAALRVAERTEAALKQEVSQLEEELSQQRQRVQTLTSEVERSQSIKQELEQAKQLILQLSEGNIKLSAELEQLKQKPVESPPAEPAKKSNLELRNILRHPVQPHIPSTALSNADIGWVD